MVNATQRRGFVADHFNDQCSVTSLLKVTRQKALFENQGGAFVHGCA